MSDLPLLRDQHALFVLSWTAIHPLSAASPLHDATPASLLASESEIIISLTGLDESFAQTVHARHSYLPGDIVWNARFADILSRLPDGRQLVDYTRFHEVVATEPRASEGDRK